jgi:hypothetical protein
MIVSFDPTEIKDIEGAQQAISQLLNLVEELKRENEALREEVQKQRDEINRLKGEQGKPDIKANKKAKLGDISSEKERRKPVKRKKESKLDKIKIDREQVLKIEQEKLPEDAEYKGYKTVVVQDIEIKTDNVCFLKEKYYSKSEEQTYLAELPAGYEGEFGPGLKALVISQYYASGMTEPKIIEFLSHFNIVISSGQVSNLLTKKNEGWHKEKDEIYKAGLKSSSWQHIDDTTTRVDGQNQHCQIVCNPLYTAYFTRPGKDRLTIIEVLQNVSSNSFILNEKTSTWLDSFTLPKWVQQTIAEWPQQSLMSYEQFEQLVNRDLHRLNKQQRLRVFESAALSAYHTQTEMPIVSLLLSDDAPQFKSITAEQALCWVHEGRHFKKLSPFLDYHRQLLDEFITQFWLFYHKLDSYRASPSLEQIPLLHQAFDTLFSTVTGYNDLDQRIAKTKAKKNQLLMVLSHPDIPLHNNPAELGARQRVRKRDISFGPRTSDGVAAWDTFMTLSATAKKLGISFFAYIYDRISGSYALPSLAQTISLLSI